MSITAITPASTGSLTRGRRRRAPTRHVGAQNEMPSSPDLAHSSADITAHQRPGEDERAGAVQPCHSANGSRQLVLAHERNRVNRDPLATDVVAVASEIAPCATMPTCAPPPMTITRLP